MVIVLKTIKEWVKENPFKMIVEEDRIYINQFQRMIILEENHICFSTLHKKIHIYGKELKTKKLVEQEILLTGIINRIEVEDAR